LCSGKLDIVANHPETYMREPTTPREQDLLDYLREQIAEHGRAPAYRVLVAALGFAPSTVSERITSLERKGYLVRTGGSGAGIVLVDDGEAVGPRPVLPLPRWARYVPVAALPHIVAASIREDEERRDVPREYRRADAIAARLRESLS
jgi:SOS-response transcriptional repressor LexA